MKNMIAPPEYEEPDVVPGCEPKPDALRRVFIAMIVFWAVVIGGIVLLYYTCGG